MRGAEKAYLTASCDVARNPKKAWKELTTLMGKQQEKPVHTIQLEMVRLLMIARLQKFLINTSRVYLPVPIQ